MKYFYIAIILLSVLRANAQRDTVSLNDDWKFSIDKKAEGLSRQWYKTDLANSRNVQVPHTWNVEPENQNHYGWGWYQKRISIPKKWRNKRLVLQFGAINHTAYIYINGKKIAENIGDGFNKISLPIDENVIYGAENVITVACNNDYGKNKVPYADSFDWPNDGGLIRTVSLIVSDKPAANYLQIEPVLNVSDKSGELKMKLGFDQYSNDLMFKVTVTETNQQTHNIILQATSQPVWQNNTVLLNYSLKQVHPWHFDFPNLYQVSVVVEKRGHAVDKISSTVGFRQFKFINNQTYLNGERIKLMGVEWTAGSNPEFGFAESDAEIIKNGKLMKDVNAIFTRQHFQQSDAFYDFCDRNGILVQEEVPLWGAETPSTDAIRTIAGKQLERMIQDHYNHPSIISWGVGNELNGRDSSMKKMIASLVIKAKELDPTRKVAYVSNTLKNGFITDPKFTPDAGSLGDYLMMNEYGGSWWQIPVGKISSYLDSIHMSYPDKPFFISEFGLCEPNFKGGDERRINDLIYHMAVYESKPYIEGAIYFDLTDYRTHYPGTSDTTKFRRRIHGVYDMYGNPKPSMKVLRELSSPIEMQGVSRRKNGKIAITILGSVGLPQYTAKGYQLYLSDNEHNYQSTKDYLLPEIKPGERIVFEVDDLYQGKGVITVVRPTGYIVLQKSF